MNDKGFHLPFLTLGLKREDENLYRSEDACYDIVYYEGENSFFLMSKAITEK